MATSSSFPTSNQYVKYYIEGIQNSQNYSNNTSSVTVRVWFYRTNSYTTWGSGTVYCRIDGTEYTSSVVPDQKITSTPIKLFEKTLTITHNADGTKSVPITAKISHNAPLTSDWSPTWYFTLSTIPRASQPSLSASQVNYGSAVTIYTNRASSSFTHTLRYNWNGRTGTIATGVGTSYSWTVPSSFMNYIPNSTSTTGTIYCDTYSGSTKIGTKSVTLKTVVPSNIVPSFSTVTHSEYVSDVATKIGSYVQGLSRLNLEITGATGAYSSTIKSYQITFDGSTYSSRTATSSTIKGSGTLTITGKITDSRGRTATKSNTISVIPYSPPVLTWLTVFRSDALGTADSLGTYSKVSMTGTFSPLEVNYIQKNTITWRIYSRLRNSTDWGTPKVTGTVASGNSFEIYTSPISGYDIAKSYEFKIEIQDQFNTIVSFPILSTGGATLSLSKTGVGIGKVWERGTVDIGGDVYIEGGLFFTASTLPAGDSTSIDYWKNIESGQYFVRPSTLTNQPSSYGFVDVFHYGGDFNVIWYTQSSGAIYRLSGNTSTITSWIKISNGVHNNYINANLENGWTNYGDGYKPAGYWREGNSVFISGLIVPGITNTTNTIFTLPSGYRPSSRVMFICKSDTEYQRVDVNVAGYVLYVEAPGTGSTINFLSLSGISFNV